MSIGIVKCTRCERRPALRMSLVCGYCASSGEPEQEPWDYQFALEAVLAHAQKADSYAVRSAAACVLEHLREQSKPRHPSGRGQ